MSGWAPGHDSGKSPGACCQAFCFCYLIVTPFGIVNLTFVCGSVSSGKACVSLSVCVHMQACLRRPEVDVIILQLPLHLIFRGKVSHRTWRSLIWQDWLGIKPQYRPLSSTGITGTCCHAWLSRMGAGEQTQVPMFAEQALWIEASPHIPLQQSSSCLESGFVRLPSPWENTLESNWLLVYILCGKLAFQDQVTSWNNPFICPDKRL